MNARHLFQVKELGIYLLIAQLNFLHHQYQAWDKLWQV
ncbi:hypothetical protein SORBI_3001G254150 [Sorghum bicolor]|uniref:Uncharacterized protein n=1 Tax=Sorghum bicolor TaxID=4558 RepID=A0A1Z5S7C9_SORBI|nr:hypothetical protein SORBI_3001G254150 [Sorghum bicolor]